MKYLSGVVLLLLSYASFSQSNPNDNLLKKITLPSPNAAELGKYGDVPIGLFTGAMEYTVPIYELKTQNLSLPVSASYSSNGVKVDQYASNIGINWALNCGGVITRSIMGRDDLREGQLVAPPTGLADGSILSNPTTDFIAFLDNECKLKNTEPDVYYYNFGKYSGKFVIDYDNQVYTIPHSTLKIEIQTNPNNNTYHSFVVTTPDGVRYYFEKVELTMDIPYNCTDPYFTPFQRETAWYITKIQHPYNDYINFTYTDISYTDTPSISQTASRLDIGGQIGTCPSTTCGDMSLVYNNCYNAVSVQGCILSGVTTSNGNRIEFLNAARADIAGNQLHSGIRIYNSTNNLVRSVNFSYAFASNNQRFFLTKLDVLASDNTINNTYGFEYQGYTLLPTRLSYAQDKYGYSNGAGANTLFVIDDLGILSSSNLSNREPNGSSSINGMLSKINYPTGGSTSIEYESHNSSGIENVLVNHAGDFTIATPGGGPGLYDQQTVEQVFNIPANANPTNLTLEIDAVYRNSGQKDTYNRRVIYQLIDLSDNSYVIGVPPNFQGVGGTAINGSILSYNSTQNTENSISYVASIKPGGSYKLILTVESANLYGYGIVSYSYTDGTTAPTETHTDYGGARVKRMTNTSNTGVTTVKNFFYGSIEGIGNSSSGASAQLIMAFTTGSKLLSRNVCTDQNTVGSCTCCSYSCLRNQVSSSLMQINLGSNHVYYSSVIESVGDNFDNGGIEHSYMVSSDEPGGAISLSSYVQNHRIINVPVSNTGYKNGTETRVRVFKKLTDGNFKIIQQEDKEYNESTYNNKEILGYSVIQHTPPICETTPQQLLLLYSVVSYRILSKWFYQSASVKTTTDDNGNVLVIREDYSYDNPNHCLLTKTTTTNSKNQIIVAQTYYPQDIVLTGTSETARQDLVSKFMLSAKLDETLTKDLAQTSERKDNYKIFPNGLTLPESIELKIGANPIEKRAEFLSYDSFGNVTEQQKTNDVIHSYLWDYFNSFLVAEVTNADSVSIAYTSFEADGTGNWTIGSAARDTTSGITGTKSYILNSDISKSGLTSATTYIVSYWTTNPSSFTIAGTISGYPIRGKTIALNGTNWTLYTHRVTGQTTITIGGTGHIDELRLYPLGAQMTTYTYTPLVGMSSQADIGNRITYYEYDGLQRLKRIRDQDYNILKSLEYQYQASSGCGGNCYTIRMQTLAGTNTLGYPVGVFDVHGKLLGTANGPVQYVSLWNTDTADVRIGTLSTGTDSLHFSLTLNTGMTLPAGVTGCRYFQVDLNWNRLDGVRNFNGAYIDFGDSTGMRMGKTYTDTPSVIAPNTTYQTIFAGDFNTNENYYVHTYADSSLKTLTFYHNDATESEDFDNLASGATGLTRLSNLRGNLPKNTPTIGGSCYQASSMTNVSAILNWNSIQGIQYFRLNKGDGVNPARNIGYAQDFMVNNRGLQSILTSFGYYNNGCRDTSFRLSRLKTNWNTYFTQLQAIQINEDHWNHEDLSALTQLQHLVIYATTQDHQDDPGSPLVPMGPTEIDSILIQVAAGAGQTIHNGFIGLGSGGGNRTSNSDTAVAFLKSKGWQIYLHDSFQ